MSTKILRLPLVQKLMAVEAGLTTRKTISQGACLVFRRGRVYTYNDEVACSLETGLPATVDGAVESSVLVGALKLIPEEMIDFFVQDHIIHIQSQRKKTQIPMEANVELPIDSVEKASGWQRLDPGFLEAVSMASKCTAKGRIADSEFLKTTVHITPDWIESSDNVQCFRFNLPTFVKKNVVVRSSSIREILPLGLTHGSETANWLHFWNPMRLRVSVRKYDEDAYPPLEEIFQIRGTKVSFPKGLADSIVRASVVLDGDKDGSDTILISAEKGLLRIEGRGIRGVHEETKEMSYDGEPFKFAIPPKLLQQIVEGCNECEVTEVSIRVDGGSYIYTAQLEVV